MLTFVGLLAVAEFALLATAQLTGPVGPSSSTSTRKATKTCNILDYGGQASKTFDNAQAITSAWAACASGGELLIPEGDFGLSTWISVKNAKNMNFNLEGTIHRTGTAGGNMIFMRNVQNFEFYSANSKGAIQGYGYEFHKDNTYGPRILRFYQSSNFSIHDITLVDAPQFHLSLDTVTNAEVYNMVIRGGSRGGLDGIDVWGDNIWIHDVEVSNKDECVTVKNPSHNFLIEQIHCNLSGGCGMGSIGSNTDISNILYRNVYTHHSNQMYMIKSNGGNGSVSNVVFDNFVGHSNAYTLDLDSAWTQVAAASGDGIAYTNISATGWHGTCSDGTQRGPVKMFCPEKVPCQDITIKDFNVWTEDGDSKVYHVCKNAYGSGSCLDGTDATTSFTSTKTITGLASTAYTYASMDNELSTSIGLTVSIAIPTLPASYFPGMLPISPYNSASGVAVNAVANTSAQSEVAATPSTTVTPSSHPVSTNLSPNFVSKALASSSAISPSSLVAVVATQDTQIVPSVPLTTLVTSSLPPVSILDTASVVSQSRLPISSESSKPSCTRSIRYVTVEPN